MRQRLQQIQALVRQYGVRRCVFRIVHDWRRRHGWLKRRFPTFEWAERPLAAWLKPGVPTEPAAYAAWRAQHAPRFFFSPDRPPTVPAEWLAGARTEAAAIRAGRFRYFFSQEGTLGWPPDWFLNPFTGQRDAQLSHWCDREDFDPARGDIKYLWEPSRFAWAYVLVRAHLAEPHAGHAETFWQLLESWCAANPPQRGPHWMCGQEIALRVLAVALAGVAFWHDPATTPARVALWVAFLAAAAERIAPNIDAARNQMGNHATSEAAGLFTVGVLLPELRGAAAWQKLGQYVLEDEARQFMFADGSYTQHSMNYQRLMLHAYLWCLRLGELNGVAFSEQTRTRVRQSYEYMHQLQDGPTGYLPNYGPNDGALGLPLSSCDYRDYRPLLGALHYLFTHTRLYTDGPWIEDTLWLFGEEARTAREQAPPRVSRDFDAGGYYTFRGADSWALVRCHSYRSRPNQADMLHLDLWWRGVNVLRDSGTYRYYDPPDNWSRYFVSTPAHNTIAVGGQDQMVKGARFQWYSLVQSHCRGRRRVGDVEVWEGEHYGYRRLAAGVTHRRTIARCNDACWLVIDDLLGTGTEDAALHWHLPDLPFEGGPRGGVLRTPAGDCTLAVLCSAPDVAISASRAEDREGYRAGWESLYYGVKTPAVTLVARARAPLPLRFVTLLSLGVSCAPEAADVLHGLRWRLSGGPIMYAVVLVPPAQDRSPLVSCSQDETRCASQS